MSYFFYERAKNRLYDSLNKAQNGLYEFDIFHPKADKFGEFSTNILLKGADKEKILSNLEVSDYFLPPIEDCGFINFYVNRKNANIILNELIKCDNLCDFSFNKFYEVENWSRENKRFYHFYILSRIEKLLSLHKTNINSNIVLTNDVRWRLIWHLARFIDGGDEKYIDTICSLYEDFYNFSNPFENEGDIKIMTATMVTLKQCLKNYYL